MIEFLDELTMEDLEGEMLFLAETIGLEAFKKMLVTYSGTSNLNIHNADKVLIPIRNRHIVDDCYTKKLTVRQLALNYGLTSRYINMILKNDREIKRNGGIKNGKRPNS